MAVPVPYKHFAFAGLGRQAGRTDRQNRQDIGTPCSVRFGPREKGGGVGVFFFLPSSDATLSLSLFGVARWLVGLVSIIPRRSSTYVRIECTSTY